MKNRNKISTGKKEIYDIDYASYINLGFFNILFQSKEIKNEERQLFNIGKKQKLYSFGFKPLWQSVTFCK
jgi:hypothetical protein